MKKRLRKKLHSQWLYEQIVDLNLDSYWRTLLLDSNVNQVFTINKKATANLSQELKDAVLRYDLEFCAAKVPEEEALGWLSEGGMVIFKFWAKEFPEVNVLSANSAETE
jgi:hypothetical protein